MGKERIFEDFIRKTANMQYKYVARSKNWGRGGGICPLVEIGLTYLPKSGCARHTQGRQAGSEDVFSSENE